MVIETDRLKIKDVSILQMKNYIDFIWRKETNKYKSGDIDNANCSVILPNSGWIAVKGKTAELDMIYQEIYADGVLTYEIETFTDEGECEILYYR